MKKLVKKLLSVTVALSMAFALCAPAMALEEYEDGAMILTEDTAITEDTDALVVVGEAGITVTVDGAKLSTGIVVDPVAEGAAIVASGEAVLGDVTVLASGTAVTVEEGAAVATLTVVATDVTATVAGEAAAIVVAETAEGIAVVVDETAAVASVVVAAPGATVEIKGTVEEGVTVAETAAGAAVTVAETATVAALTVHAEDVTAAIAGTVTTVEVSDTAAGLTIDVAETAVVETLVASEDVMANVEITGDGAESVPDAEAPSETSTAADAGGSGASDSSSADDSIGFQPPVMTPTPDDDDSTTTPDDDDSTTTTPPAGGNNTTGQGVSVGNISIAKELDAAEKVTHLLKVEFTFDTSAKKVTGYLIEWVMKGTAENTDGDIVRATYSQLGTDGSGEEIPASGIYTVDLVLESGKFVYASGDNEGKAVNVDAITDFSGTYQVILDYTVENADGEEVTDSTKTDVFAYDDSETPDTDDGNQDDTDNNNPDDTDNNNPGGTDSNNPGSTNPPPSQGEGEGEGNGDSEGGNPPEETPAPTALSDDFNAAPETNVPETEIENA